jgi:hypothetical protein
VMATPGTAGFHPGRSDQASGCGERPRTRRVGALLATLFTYDGKGIGFTPDGLFFGDADPPAFAIAKPR